MSLKIAKETYVVPSELGTFIVHDELVEEYDVEDIIRARAESQMKVLQMINKGNELSANQNLDNELLPTIFKGIDLSVELNEG